MPGRNIEWHQQRLSVSALASVKNIAHRLRLKSAHWEAQPFHHPPSNESQSQSRRRQPQFHSEQLSTIAHERYSSIKPLSTELCDRLPIEIYERIVGFLFADRMALSTCSLVCRSWYYASRYHLFSGLKVIPTKLWRTGGYVAIGTGLNVAGGYQAGRINCAAHLKRGDKIVLYGMDDGIHVGLALQANSLPTKVVNMPNIQQLEVLQNSTILIFRSGNQVFSTLLASLEIHSGKTVEGLAVAQRVSSHATFIKAGQCMGKQVVCVVKAGILSTTCKLFEPTVKAGRVVMELFKTLYIPQAVISVYFHNQHIILGTNGKYYRGFEIVDLTNLTAQPFYDIHNTDLHFVKHAKCLSIKKLEEEEWLLCFEQFAFYATAAGTLSRSEIINFTHTQKEIHFLANYMIGVSEKALEIRSTCTGELIQVVKLKTAAFRVLSGSASGVLIVGRTMLDGGETWVDVLQVQ